MQPKDFQERTIAHAVAQLEQRGHFLVADEVGLGKTIIAKGVIDNLYKRKPQGRKFHVIYICSNQVLARQNLQKLAPYEDPENFSRLIFMFEHSESKSDFRISTLTPGTSFKLTRSKGLVTERAILYRLLRESMASNISTQEEKRLKDLLQGDCSIETWQESLKSHSENEFSLRENVDRLFAAEVKRSGTAKMLKEHLADPKRHRPVELIVALRRAATNVILDHLLDADLFILDEFQRFQTLIKTTDTDDTDETEIAQTAKRIFDNPKHRILLLSATPFNPFATQWDNERGDSHLEAFDDVLRFLDTSPNRSHLARIKQNQLEYFDAIARNTANLRHLTTEANFQASKINLEKEYLTLLARTERSLVESGSLLNVDSMVRLLPTDTEISGSVAAIKHLPQKAFTHLMVEFCKSVPYPYSFTTGYKLHESIMSERKKGKIPTQLFLPLESWNKYEHRNQGLHAKLDHLLQQCLPEGAELKLWIPPAARYYRTANADTGFSKTLIFSSWAMVPRATSILLSYEYERRLFGQSGQSYFPKEDRKGKPESRRPVAQLKFRSSSDSDSLSLAMLLYPSRHLAMHQPFEIDPVKTCEELRHNISKNMQARFSHFRPSSSNTHTDFWNWYALFYVDDQRPEISEWLRGRWLLFDPEHDTDGSDTHGHDQSERGKEKFLIGLRGLISNQKPKQHDEIPTDLLDTLALVSIGSPAVCAYRSLRKTFTLAAESDAKSKYTESEFVEFASMIALGFVSLFNRPEAIQAIRSSIKTDKPYWHQCLEYAANEHIQAMLDEYVYLLADNGYGMKAIAERISDALRVRTTSLEALFHVESSKIESRKVRCHYAVDFGQQRLGTAGGADRLVSLRDVFNSPFRPFVLTSTSIGQEGLDFHWYCRNIYHWNLPHNPIDLEQREGRINRYMSHSIRLNHAADFMKDVETNKSVLKRQSFWEIAVNRAATRARAAKGFSCDLVPYWHVHTNGPFAYRIQRFAPVYAFSSDEERYQYFLRVLALYRLTFGQPNQEQALRAFMQESDVENPADLQEIIRRVAINLAPISHQ